MPAAPGAAGEAGDLWRQTSSVQLHFQSSSGAPPTAGLSASISKRASSSSTVKRSVSERSDVFMGCTPSLGWLRDVKPRLHGAKVCGRPRAFTRRISAVIVEKYLHRSEFVYD